MSDTGPNPYEERARRAKVQHMVTHFESRGIHVDHIRNAHPAILEHYAKSAGLTGQRTPSPDTWKQVVDTMDYLSKTRVKNQGKDPFEGLT